MISHKKSANKQRHHYRPLLVTALIAGSIFQLVAPALADGTVAGTSISNTATGTYEDPNAPGTTINATSNTVTVTVAKVAGITLTASGVTNTTGGTSPIKFGDVLSYNYTVTNVGNSAIDFRIPNTATTTGPGTVSGTIDSKTTKTGNNLQVSTDGGANWKDISGSELVTTPIPAGGSVLVRVPVTVATSAQTGDTISVQLGNTPGNAQNVLRSPDGGDVYTVDDASPTSLALGDPVNGTREASATQQVKVGNSTKNLALATILKTRTGYSNAGTPNALNDDVLTYGLSLRVEQNDVTNSGVTPAPLAGTNISVDTGLIPRILVSDAIPLNTVLQGTPTAPIGWKVVYSSDAVGTDAKDAKWVTTLPATITRVGFINDPTSGVNSVAPGQTVTGFTIQVITSGIASTTTTPVSIANIAQVFGQTLGDATNTLVYDDSGDQNPNNYDPIKKIFGPTDPKADTGYIPDPTQLKPADIDSGNNNTGTAHPAEANVYTIAVPAATSVLNGPQNVPDATGATDNNDDFTNKSALIPANTPPGTKVTPPAVTFTNTVKNTGLSTANISILPVAPGVAGDLPTDSLVTVSYGSLSATYKYDGNGNFAFVSGTGTVNGKPMSDTNPLQIANLAPNTTANYGVEVKLPAKTPLSTDTGKGFPVPVDAFVDANSTGLPTGQVQNKSIDRVYTGYVRMVKQSRVLQGTGPAVPTNQGDFTTTPGAAFDPLTNPSGATTAANEIKRTPAPGNILEYRIVYTNISTPQAGTGNIILNANKVVITEDGTATPNNWALDNDNNGQIDTSNISGTAKDSGAATVTFFSGKPATTSGTDQTGTTVNTDVSKYVDTVTDQVAPGQIRTFGFQRQMN